MIFDYSTILIVVQLINNPLGLTLFGLLLALIFEKLKVIEVDWRTQK